MTELEFRIKAGLDVPIAGAPEQRIDSADEVGSVAVLGPDYHGLKPSLKVAEGDRVRLGQLLLEDKANPALRLTAPGCGRIAAIRRGTRRVLHNIEIELEGEEEETFGSYPSDRLATLDREQIVDNLVASGLWSAFRTRPFSRVPRIDEAAHAIFVPAMDSNPLAASPEPILAEDPDAFTDGLVLLSRLTEGTVYVCIAPDSLIPTPNLPRVRVAAFRGPHPAGLVGTHIHFLDPVDEAKAVWHVGYQDVVAMGRLFRDGRLDVQRIIAIGGPVVREPRLLRTRLGADISELLRQEIAPFRCRVISGSVLSGRRASDWAAFLGRYHTQISVLPEGGERKFLGWLTPGSRMFSATRMFVSGLLADRGFDFDTSTHGSPRAMVPIGTFEQVMPLDILPAPLLKSLIVDDTESARALGALELDEEDLALCSFVCSGKYDYGRHLRRNLDRIEAEG